MQNAQEENYPENQSEEESEEEEQFDENGEPLKKKRKKARTTEEKEYEKLEKRLKDEKAAEILEKLKRTQDKMVDVLEYDGINNNNNKEQDKKVEAGPSCFIPDRNKEQDAYQVYKLRQDKKKIRFILPERQKTVYDYATLKLSAHYNNILSKLTNSKLEAEMAHDEESYNLIIEANALIADIDFEIVKVYNFTRDVYTTRFPELETLLANKVEYVRAAGVMLNDLLNAKALLTDKISDAQVMIVAMTATSTQGKKLDAGKIEAIKEACSLAEDLTKDRGKIVRFVKSRMSLLAPNVTAIVGPNVAAQLIGKAADGLAGLSTMPSCNILLLGQEKAGTYSAHNKLPHAGYIYYSPLVQSIAKEHQRKAARLVSAKVVQAARKDAQLTSRERREEPFQGLELRDAIYKKFELWEEPPKVKGIKALPKPLEHAGKRKRGGRRYRKMKERLGMTEVRKQSNRMTFGEIEEDLNQEDLGISLGHLKEGTGSGVLRNLVEEKKSKVRISKKMEKTLEKERSMSGARTAISSGFRTVHKELSGGKSTVLGWGGTMTSTSGRKSSFRRGTGTTSTVSFTPVQGLEITNPALNNQNEDENSGMSSNYFSQSSLFKTPTLPNPSRQGGMSSRVPGGASSYMQSKSQSIIPKF